MKVSEIRKKYLDFMESKGHIIVKSASLVPENDPTTLFTAAGMQPMLNYILGEKNPAGRRIADSQKCFRSQDIEEIGDNRHTTFFEMLGNWSFGDYFKAEQISFLYEFLMDKKVGLGLDKDRLYFSYYKGDEKLGIKEDVEVKNYLMEKDIKEENIFAYGNEKNWWSRAGTPENMPEGEPGGPDSEVFFDFDAKSEKKIHENSKYKNEKCHLNCDCGRFVEIGNSVFIQYLKKDGEIQELSQKNVDFGGGLERLTMAINDDLDVFNLDIFSRAKEIIKDFSKVEYNLNNRASIAYRIILDHIRAATFLISDGVLPGNKNQMYFVRRLIRRAVYYGREIYITNNFTSRVAMTFIDMYKNEYENLEEKKQFIWDELDKEENKFKKTLDNGMKEFEKISDRDISGEEAFNLLQSFGFPIELTKELAERKAITVDISGFEKLKAEHADKSRTASAGMFKGGLTDHSEITTALHTASHLMLAGMKKALGGEISQKGSNINNERVRFDFNFDRSLNATEIKEIEEYVNSAIHNGFVVKIEEMSKTKAKAEKVSGAFWEKYPEIVKVYNIIGKDNQIYSRELCGGPHVKDSEGYFKGKNFKIIKQEGISGGIRRIKAVLE